MFGHFSYFVHDVSFSCIIDIYPLLLFLLFSVHFLTRIGVQHLSIFVSLYGQPNCTILMRIV